MSTLSERLARLRASGKAPKTLPEGAAAGKSPDRPEDGRSAGRIFRPERWASRARSGEVPGPVRSLRDARPPGEGWFRAGDFVWERTLERRAVLPGLLNSGFILPSGTRAEDLVFYDLETTGLSGGTGNTAFLIGLGSQRGGSFRVVQLFLADYPGEAGMLERYAEFSAGKPPQVSYNGRSFDSQVLKTRFLLNRMVPTDCQQVDLLYPSRRLWGGILPDLTLGTLEREVLGFRRSRDLPGREAPDAWFEWLEGGEGRIEGVFRHNADDIASLASLLAKFEEWALMDPGGGHGGVPSGAPVSARGMARQWAFADPDIEKRWLEAGWAAGEIRCGRELAVRLRREGNFDGARAVWEELNSGGCDYDSAVQLAKHWEHREKDPGTALLILENLDSLPLTERHRRDLAHRRRRLHGKLGRSVSRPSADS